jgi:prepilin-type N-terminal cleavage/methylation domain-containing protein
MQEIRSFNNTKGFTLIELMVVLAISSIVIGAIYGVFASVGRSSTNNEVTAEVMQHIRTSIDFMEQDIRMAGLDRFDTADAGIVGVPTTVNLRFTADRNRDGSINTADLTDGIQEIDLEDITYSYDAANSALEQCLSGANCETVAENVTFFQFTYLDEDNSPLPAPVDASLVRSVQVSITIEQPAGRAGPVNRNLVKRILCRNLSF